MSAKRYTKQELNLAKKRDVESWIYSYADLITNLLALFVMMLTVTQAGGAAKREMAKGFKEYSQKQSAKSPIESTPPVIESKETLYARLFEQLKEDEWRESTSLSKTKSGVKVTFEGTMLFDKGESNLRSTANGPLGRLASILNKLDIKYILDVEGHTDSTPVQSEKFPSNWELSSARAGSVVRTLESMGVARQKMRAIGLSDTEPLSEDTTDSLNRRVTIKINTEVPI
jgi:chemotaxis protein MotB